jgi:circadian clock protein KaiC
LQNEAILRAELRRLFRWLRDRDLTAVITGERGETTLTRHGLEEYVSDAVIQLDHRVHEQISTRRIRVVKYRGTHHGTNEYPFLIDADGLSVLPVTSLTLQHDAPSDRVSSGLEQLDEMLGGHGYFRGSTILVSGTAGTGKTTLAAHFADAACRRAERCLYFLFEESPAQMIRNMRSAGVDLTPWVDSRQLQFQADRPSRYGLETHLVQLHRTVEQFQPDVVVVDPMTNLLAVGTQIDVRAMLTRVIDFLKARNTTALFTSLTSAGVDPEGTETMISSLMDTWVLMSAEEVDRRRRRSLFVLKSRGMAHSDEVRAFRFTEHGLDIHAMPVADREGK